MRPTREPDPLKEWMNAHPFVVFVLMALVLAWTVALLFGLLVWGDG